MTTGRTRALAMKLGVIDVGDAEENYAKTLGVTKDVLSDAGKVEAHRIAVMQLLSAGVKDAGLQQRDFGEQIEYAKARIANWTDELASAVAASPNVMRAVDAIGAALAAAFGGSSDTAINAIIGGINAFADAVTATAPYIVTLKNALVGVFTFVSDHADLFESIAAALLLYKAATIATAAVQAALAFGVTGVTTAIGAATTAVGAFVVSTGPILVALASLTAVLYAGKVAWDAWRTSTATAQQAAKTASQEQQNLTDINKKFGTSFTVYGDAVKYAQERMKENHAAQVGLDAATKDAFASVNLSTGAVGAQSKAMIDAEAASKKHEDATKALREALKQQAGALIPLTAEQKKAVEVNKELNLSNAQIAEILHVTESAVAKYGDAWKKADDAIKKSNASLPATMAAAWDKIIDDGMTKAEKYNQNAIAAIKKNLAAAATWAEEALQLEQKRGLGEYEAQRQAIQRSAALQASGLDSTKAGYQDALDALKKLTDERLRVLAEGDVALQDQIDQDNKKLTISYGLMEDLKKIPDMIAGAFTGGGGIVGAAKGIGSMLSSTLGEHLGKGVAALGKLGGPVGAAIGSLAGPLIEMFAKMFDHTAKDFKRMGQELGVNLSAGLIDQLKKDKNLYGGEVQAMLMNLDKVVAEGGGLIAFGMEKALRKTTDLFSALETGKLTATQVGTEFDKMFGILLPEAVDKFTGLASKAFLDLIETAERFNTTSQAMTDFLAAQSATVATGFNAVAQAVIGPMAKASQALKDAGQDTDKLKAAMQQAGAAAVGSQEAFDRTGRLAVAAFGAALAGGQTLLQAIASIGPGVDTLSVAQETFGLKSEGSLAKLMAFEQFASVNKDLIAGLDGVNQMMSGMANLGLLDQQTFDDLTKTATDTFDAMVKGGVDGNLALASMQPTLQTIWQLQQDNGLVVDENTQKLLDQAEAAGIVGKDHEDAMLRAAKAMDHVADTLDRIAEMLSVALPQAANDAAAGVVDAFNKIHPDVTVKINYDQSDAPDNLEVIQEAAGDFGTVTKPTLFLAGEAGPEQVAFSGANKKFGSDGFSSGGGGDDGTASLLSDLPFIIRNAVRDGMQRTVLTRR